MLADRSVDGGIRSCRPVYLGRYVFIADDDGCEPLPTCLTLRRVPFAGQKRRRNTVSLGYVVIRLTPEVSRVPPHPGLPE